MPASPFDRQLFDRLPAPPPPCPQCGRIFERATTNFIPSARGMTVPCPVAGCAGEQHLRFAWEPNG